ncbi:protein abrupt isoform X1 [Tribolium madens]|uniref:protein abrupt isoform X1 n=1 Tax=Tribolium madens TaxID=41895 RepID=UPI001CF7395A|nr:protein abrupt isoform X1 [Tribolium madens]XP_044266616.1 protein abrupt isoform X1 [Tribolium madens]XP_044266617.1 protein abrupt isoform X1 [Tribolium madens]XP_044266618.1 protein abrupt isoform X1 [Tribolium madens]XP_044266619.1 protein abrupt isoform X1 [Tribolium madens]
MGGDTSPEQQYSLRWNDFHSSILSSFRHLRDEEDFVDVTLACDGCSFTAHKVVLSACSPYFRRLLKANPCQHPIVILRDVQQKDMESLLRFMYNGEVHIGQEQLTDFLKTAQMLQVRGLADVPAGTAGQRLTAPEQKISPNSSSLPWATDRSDALREGALSPPPAKRSRSSERGTYTPDRGRSPSRGNGDMQESLLGQALEGGPTILTKEKGNSDSSLQAQSTGEDSNSSDTAMSDHGDPVTPKTEPSDYPMLDDHHPFNTNGGLIDQTRTPTFPGALLGLQGLGGLMPGPSGIHNSTDNFVSRRSLDMMRVRATDPRPCPKCGKIYRSAHTLRTHLEDKHTICPGYRCVLCGTVAKSRNSLHSHMSRQHRGISTKDLPVLPMPAPFDPELASRLLAKAGVKISPAELRARASPTGPRRSDVKLDAKSAYSGAASEAGSSICGDNDPEDLTISHQRYGGLDLALSPPSHYPNSNFRFNSTGQAVAAKSVDSLAHNLSKEPYPAPLPPPVSGANSTGSAILDTYLQFITENSLGMGMMSSEQAAAAVHAAKLAQLNAMGLDKASQQHFLEKMQQQMQSANELMMKRNDEIRRGDAEMVNHEREREKENDEGESSGGEEEDYSEDEAEPEAVKAGE